MSVQILDIVIYSHDGRRRELPLKPGKVNIITGAPTTGKSSLIEMGADLSARRDFPMKTPASASCGA
jgi:hypothetical protein